MIHDDRKDAQYREVLGAPPELELYAAGSPLPVPMGAVAVPLGGIPAHCEVDDITSGQARPFNEQNKLMLCSSTIKVRIVKMVVKVRKVKSR